MWPGQESRGGLVPASLASGKHLITTTELVAVETVFFARCTRISGQCELTERRQWTPWAAKGGQRSWAFICNWGMRWSWYWEGRAANIRLWKWKCIIIYYWLTGYVRLWSVQERVDPPPPKMIFFFSLLISSRRYVEQTPFFLQYIPYPVCRLGKFFANEYQG